MTPEVVCLVLGLCTVGTVVYGIHAWASGRANERIESAKLMILANGNDGLTAANIKRVDEIAGLQARVAKLEAAMRIDGLKITAEANRAALPAFMK